MTTDPLFIITVLYILPTLTEGFLSSGSFIWFVGRRANLFQIPPNQLRVPPAGFGSCSFCFCLTEDLFAEEDFGCGVGGSCCNVCEVDPGSVTRGISCRTYPQTTQTVIVKTINTEVWRKYRCMRTCFIINTCVPSLNPNKKSQIYIFIFNVRIKSSSHFRKLVVVVVVEVLGNQK